MPQLQSENLSKDNPAEIDWVEIPTGEFLYGYDKERKNLRKAYLIGKYPVTNAQYKLFIDANPSHPLPGYWDKNSRSFPLEKVNHPVVNVSWLDAGAFCIWNGCRLATEEEWEKAARGDNGWTYPWGEDWLDGKYANSREAGIGDTSPVNTFPEGISPYSVWDMSGNIWEWTDSWYSEDRDSRVLRGGSWGSNVYNVRSAYRNGFNPITAYSFIGFRCAASLQP